LIAGLLTAATRESPPKKIVSDKMMTYMLPSAGEDTPIPVTGHRAANRIGDIYIYEFMLSLDSVRHCDSATKITAKIVFRSMTLTAHDHLILLQALADASSATH
jgi:hypothetical protein